MCNVWHVECPLLCVFIVYTNVVLVEYIIRKFIHLLIQNSVQKLITNRFSNLFYKNISFLDENLLNLTQDQIEIAELGKPRLGEFRKCQITIKESKEFQARFICRFNM